MKQSRFLWAGVVLLAAAALWWWSQRLSGVWKPALSSREVATRVLAEHLKTTFPGDKALVIGNPFSQRAGQAPEVYAFEEASVRGLELGFGSPDAVQVAYPELRREFLQDPKSVFVDPKTTTPLSFLVAEGSFDQLSAAHGDRELLVSLIGLPLQATHSKVWQAPKPRLALLLPDWRMIGDRETIRQSVKSGKIAAAVVNRPGAPGEDTEPSQTDYREAFERRFILVTATNIDEVLQGYPQLF